MKQKQQIKLSQEVKRMACNILDPHHRGAFIRTMYQAELEEQQYKNKRKRGSDAKSETPKDGGNDE